MKIRILVSFLLFFNTIAMEKFATQAQDSLDEDSSAVAALYSRYKGEPAYCNHCSHHVANMQYHIRKKILPHLLRCAQCQLAFQNYYFLAAHQIDYWNQHYSCATCTQIFTHQTDFEAHACAHIPIKKEKIEKTKDYFCVCKHTFATQSGLLKHKKKCKIYLEFGDS